MGLGIAGLALAVIGIGAAVFFWIRPRRFARLKYATYSENLVKDFKAQVEGLAVTYEGMEVTTLTVTKLAFWNAGSEPLDKEDISGIDPLRVVVEPSAAQWDMDVVSSIPDASGTKLGNLIPRETTLVCR